MPQTSSISVSRRFSDKDHRVRSTSAEQEQQSAVQRRKGDDDLLDELQDNRIHTVARRRDVSRSRSPAVNKMIFAITLLVVLCPFTLWWFSFPGNQSVASSIGCYEYFLMTLQWPPTVCMRSRCVSKINQTFGIHGLWPTNTKWPFPQNCSNVSYHEMPELKVELHERWPNLVEWNTDEGFWKDEWDKHGTCSLDKFNQTEYFKLALNIAKNVDLLKLLKKRRIMPGHNKSYNIVDIVKAVRDGINNKEPGILCYNKTKTSHFLQEIRVCLEANGHSYKDCPGSIRARNCSKGINITLPI